MDVSEVDFEHASGQMCAIAASHKGTKQAKRGYLKLRWEVIQGYGGKCACCKERNSWALCIDHIHNDGAAEREDKAFQGRNFLMHLKLNGFPKDRYQLLCYNCNMTKQHLGMCMHEYNRSMKSVAESLV